MTASSAPARRRPTRPASTAVSALAVAACAIGLGACGGDDEITDASGGQPFAVSANASFDDSQRLSNVETLRITVRNADTRTIPDAAVVLEGLNRVIPAQDNGAGRVADPRRPIWVVDAPPKGGTTAYVQTWALGELAPGASKTFTWQLTPVVAGRHTLRWRTAAALDENGPVRASGGPSSGSFDVTVSDE